MDFLNLIVSLVALLFGGGILIRFFRRARVYVELKSIQDLFAGTRFLNEITAHPHLLTAQNKGSQTAEDVSIVINSKIPIAKNINQETNEKQDRVSHTFEDDDKTLKVSIKRLRKNGYVKIGFQTSELSAPELSLLIGKGTLIGRTPYEIPRYIRAIAITWILTSVLIAIPTLIKGWKIERELWLLEPQVYLPLGLAIIAGVTMYFFSRIRR